MRVVLQERIDPPRSLCQRRIVKTNPKGTKTECLFADGTSVLLSNFLANFIRIGDELLFPLQFGATEAGTEIYVRNTNPKDERRDVFQAEIGYAAQPRKDRRDNLFVSAEVRGSRLGICATNLRCEKVRDYFYVGNRRRPWDRQPSFYELLRVNPKASPTELRLAFKLRTLELCTAHAPTSDLRAVERAFNILANPELRACYDVLLSDPESPSLFPYGGFGSLLVAGDISRDGSTFYASRILSFLPEQKFKYFLAPLRNLAFYNDHAVYRDSRRKLEVLFDQTSLPLRWDPGWNRWKHLIGARIGIKGTFVQRGKYQRRGDKWCLVNWETAVPSRFEVALPTNITEQITVARQTHHRFGQYAEALDHIRARIESAPVESTDLRELCVVQGIPGDFNVQLITWKPDYEAFFYNQLCKRARRLYLFRSEYIFDLEKAVVVETPQLGHATYLFSKPANMADFLAIYACTSKDQIRRNCNNVGEKLGFMGRLIHGNNPQAWVKELKKDLGEAVDYTEVSVG